MFGVFKLSVLCTIFISVCQGHINPPSNLMFKWLDPLTVRVSWDKPNHRCDYKYELKLNGSEEVMLDKTHYQVQLLTEAASKWVCTVKAFCHNHKSSAATLIIQAPPPAVVKDFRCYLSDYDMNCSWVSDLSSPVRIKYRECGKNDKILSNGLTDCKETYRQGQRTVCHLRGNFLQRNLCLVAESPHGVSTFSLQKGVKLSYMNISEQGSNLVLNWTPLEVHASCFVYNICYSACNKHMICLDHSLKTGPIKIPYDESCQYKFKYKAHTKENVCQPIYSGWSDDIFYGSTDRTLTVVAVVIPLFVSACVILSCICFRRHKDIICPNVPDPSTIFKEMMNSNKETKPNVSMYLPVQEPVEPIVIVSHIPHGSGLAPT